MISRWRDVNIAAWIIFLVFLATALEGYNTSKDLQRVCELLGPHDVGTSKPQNSKEEIDTICINHEPDDGGNDN